MTICCHQCCRNVVLPFPVLLSRRSCTQIHASYMLTVLILVQAAWCMYTVLLIFGGCFHDLISDFVRSVLLGMPTLPQGDFNFVQDLKARFQILQVVVKGFLVLPPNIQSWLLILALEVFVIKFRIPTLIISCCKGKTPDTFNA
jgi:hypothetical protein